MATTKQILKQHNVTAEMAKRLAQLSAGVIPNYGTSMGGLVYRGMVAVTDGRHQLTDLGRETIDGLRSSGW